MSEPITSEAPVMNAAPAVEGAPIAPVLNAAITPIDPNAGVEGKGKVITFKAFCLARGVKIDDKAARKDAMKVFDGLKKEFYTKAKAAASVYVSSGDYIVTKCLKSEKSGNINIICTPKKDEVSIVPVKAKLTAAEAKIAELEAKIAAMEASK
jgi:hypothetical protein